MRVCLARGDHANGGGAVVQAPVDVGGRVGAGAQAAIGIGVRRQQQHGVGHGAHHAADGVAQAVAGRAVFLGHDVAAVAVQHRHVHMHAAAGEVAVRLGHEGGVPAMLAGDALDDALQQERVVGRGHRSDTCLRFTSYWPGPFSRTHGVGRQVLPVAGIENIRQHRFETVQFGDRKHLRLPALPAALVGDAAGDTGSRGVRRRSMK